MKRSICGICAAVLCFAPSLDADDGAASIAAGGIVMKHEPRVTMAKEVLRISPSKVLVDYDFRNDTDAEVTTTVAFPVPPYELDWDEHFISQVGFSDFQLSVDGKPIHFEVEAKAYLKGRDVSDQLRRLRIDIATFGHFDEQSHLAHDIRRLTNLQRSSLVRAGLLDVETDQDEGLWKVKKNYYWQQTFPAHGVVHIWHQYTPVLGGTNSVSYGLSASSKSKNEDERYSANELNSLCIEPKLKQSLLKTLQETSVRVPFIYVDFILTTANTWKTPIEDFTLIVERPPASKSIVSNPTPSNRWDGALVSFCWDGPVEKTDATHFTAHLTNFVPKKELRVGFLSVEHIDPEKF